MHAEFAPPNMLRIALTLSVLASWLTGCHSRAASPAPAIEQWRGASGGGETAGTRILRSTAEWQAFWKNVNQPPPRSLDPSRELAVPIMLGQRRTAGYRAEVIRSHAVGDEWVVEYREHKPEPGTMVAQMITDPWVIAIVPRTDRPVTIRRLDEPPPPRAEN